MTHLSILPAEKVVWYLGLFHLGAVQVTTSSTGFLPLVGLSAVVPYFGSRVLRQFGYRQVVPRQSDASEFHFCFAPGL